MRQRKNHTCTTEMISLGTCSIISKKIKIIKYNRHNYNENEIEIKKSDEDIRQRIVHTCCCWYGVGTVWCGEVVSGKCYDTRTSGGIYTLSVA